jgi:hypothetical protein
MKSKSGRKIHFTPEFLQDYARTLKGKPINVQLREDGTPGDHSTVVVGAIESAAFDPGTNKVGIIGSLYRHYYPETVSRLIELQKSKKLDVSAELSITDGEEEEDDTIKPKMGWFSGLGIVGKGADLGQRVHYLLQAYESDEERLKEAKLPKPDIFTDPEPLAGSFEWVGNQVAEHLANTVTTGSPVITGTFTDNFVYQTNTAGELGGNTWRIHFSQDGDSLKFGEPEQVSSKEPVTSVVSPTMELNMPSEQEFADLRQSLQAANDAAEEYKTKFEELEQKIATERATREAERVALARLEEVNEIAPYTDEALKAEHLEIFKTADDKTFNAMKVLLAAAAEPKGGIAPGGKVPTQDPDADPGEAEAMAALPKWREELAASFPNAVVTAAE